MSQHQKIAMAYLNWEYDKWMAGNSDEDDNRPKWDALDFIVSEEKFDKAIFMPKSNDQILYVCAFGISDNLLYIASVCKMTEEEQFSILHMIALMIKKYNLNIAIQNTKENIQIIHKLLPADVTGETQDEGDTYILHTANMNVNPYILEGYYNMYIDGRRN